MNKTELIEHLQSVSDILRKAIDEKDLELKNSYIATAGVRLCTINLKLCIEDLLETSK